MYKHTLNGPFELNTVLTVWPTPEAPLPKFQKYTVEGELYVAVKVYVPLGVFE